MQTRKIYLLGVVAAAALLSSALAATQAFALETVFLVDGAVAKEAATTIEGLIFIEVQTAAKESIGLYHCSAIFDGTVGTGNNGKKDEITLVLNLAGEEIGELSGGKAGLDCEVVKTVALSCDNASKLLEAWPDNLPWPSSLILVGGATDDKDEGTGKIPGFDLMCLDSAGFVHENLCEGPLLALLENTVENDILAKFAPQEFGKPCAAAEELGFFEGTWLMTVAGKTLSVGEG